MVFEEVVEGAADVVEVKMAGNTFQQKTRVRSQTSRRWRERRLSDSRWLEEGEEESRSDIVDISIKQLSENYKKLKMP